MEKEIGKYRVTFRDLAYNGAGNSYYDPKIFFDDPKNLQISTTQPGAVRIDFSSYASTNKEFAENIAKFEKNMTPSERLVLIMSMFQELINGNKLLCEDLHGKHLLFSNMTTEIDTIKNNTDALMARIDDLERQLRGISIDRKYPVYQPYK